MGSVFYNQLRLFFGSWFSRAALAGLMLVACGGVVRAESMAFWSHRMTIRFAVDVPGTLTNFPTLVMLDPDAIEGFDYADFASAADGADLRFADASETNSLNYDIEIWDTNGVSVVWVQAPLISDTNDVIYAYWGRDGVDTHPSVTNGVAWSNGFEAVWHMGQGGDSRPDASDNEFDGTLDASGVAPTNWGKIGPGDVFSGGGIDCGNLSVTGDQTIEMWIYPTGFASRRNPINKAYGGEGTITIEIGADMNYYWGTAGGNSNPYQSVNSSENLSASTWTHIAVVRDLSSPSRTVRWYINGRQTVSVAASYSAATASSANLLLGRGYTSPFQGQIDEVRISSVARDTNWVWATWFSQASNDVFLAISDAGPMATNLAVEARAASAIGDTYATLNGKVLHAGEAENPDVYICWGTVDGLTNATTDWDHVIAMGTNWGQGDSFSTNIIGLLSGSTYVYRAYVTNSTGEVWSDPATFTTRTLPAITNDGPLWTRRRQTRLAGELTDDGGEPAWVWVEYWPDSGTPTSSVTVGTFSARSFEIGLDSLDSATTYLYRFGASNAAGAVWSSVDGLTTLTGDPIGWYAATNGVSTTGIDWTNAFSELPAALAVAEAGDTIYMKGETFPLNAAVEWTTSGITIQGGYAGNEVGGLPGEHDPDQWATALEREGSVNHRILEIDGVTNGTLRQVIVRNGYIAGTVYGAGLHIQNCSTFLVDDCIVESNRIGHTTINQYPRGAGLYSVSSTLMITNSVFRWNATEGGVNAFNGSGHGAGLYVNGGLAEIVDSVMVSNTAFQAGNQGGSGGGIYLNGGGPHRIFNTRIIHNLSSGNRQGYGGGLFMTGVNVALVENSIIAHNRAWGGGTYEPRGGGVWMNGGTIRNTLIANNASRHTAGGVWMQHASSQLQNVTVVDNTSDALGSSAGLHLLAGALTNSIIYHNTRTVDGARANIPTSGGTVGYSCTWPLRDGPGNTNADPEWVDRLARNYRVRPGAPGVDAGTNLAWMAAADDVEFENPRIVGTSVDMGAYEVDLESGPLAINFIASPNSALDELNAEITAYVGGSSTNGLYFWWDIDNNGTVDLEGADKQVINHTYGPGTYSVRLVVSNSIGEIDELIKEDYIVISSSLIYVSLDGDHSDGLDWAGAYTNLQTALDNAGVSNTILVAQGIYETNTFLSWSGHSHVTIRGGYEGVGTPGAHDPEQWPTVFRQTSSSARVMLMNELDQCRLEQVTVTGGFVWADGGGIRVLNSDVTIADCVISNNIATAGANTYRKGGGIYIEGSTVMIRRCRILGNTSRVTAANWTGWSRGGGVYLESGSAVVENSFIVSNISYGANNQGSFGAGVSHAAGTQLRLRNCLIYDNENTPANVRSHQGAGVELFNGGKIENCTIAGNRTYNTADEGAGLRVNGGAVTNTIVYGNLRAGESQDIGFGGLADESLVFFSCAPELTDGINGNINTDPRYRDLAGGDLRVRLDSPCVDTGKDAEWMTDAVDLAGNPRIQWGIPDRARQVDRGAYETVPLPGSTIRIR